MKTKNVEQLLEDAYSSLQEFEKRFDRYTEIFDTCTIEMEDDNTPNEMLPKKFKFIQMLNTIQQQVNRINQLGLEETQQERLFKFSRFFKENYAIWDNNFKVFTPQGKEITGTASYYGRTESYTFAQVETAYKAMNTSLKSLCKTFCNQVKEYSPNAPEYRNYKALADTLEPLIESDKGQLFHAKM